MTTERQHYPANTEFSKLDPRITKSYSACSSLFISQRKMRFFRFDETPLQDRIKPQKPSRVAVCFRVDEFTRMEAAAPEGGFFPFCLDL